MQKRHGAVVRLVKKKVFSCSIFRDILNERTVARGGEAGESRGTTSHKTLKQYLEQHAPRLIGPDTFLITK